VSTGARLERRLGTGDAVVVGLSAMLGAGVFAVWGPALAASGRWLLVALTLAAVVAFCNATSSAQLARRYPASGGTYVFGREVLGPWWGFLAGWGFVVGKTASCAAMAMAFAAYAVPGSIVLQRVLGVVAVAALTGATVLGVTRTARVARWLLAVTLVVLVVFVVVAVPGAAVLPSGDGLPGGSVGGVLQAAGLLFFAFAGYARIATLAEEVRRPEMIGRAILVAFAVAVVLYAAVGAAVVGAAGAGVDIAAGGVDGGSPLLAVLDATGAAWVQPLVRVGAVTASLGALLALLAGVSRTTLAMARERDLPERLAQIEPRHCVPRTAQVVIGLVVMSLVALVDLRGAIGFSSFGVLVYYAVANLSALRQPAQDRHWPRLLGVVGLVGCVTLAVMLPLTSVLSGLCVLLAGCLYRLVVVRRQGGGEAHTAQRYPET
jgi:APA family basic amino acid/polyamine antiporter